MVVEPPTQIQSVCLALIVVFCMMWCGYKEDFIEIYLITRDAIFPTLMAYFSNNRTLGPIEF